MQVNASAIEVIALLPRAGCTSGEEVGRATESLRAAGIDVIVYEYFEDRPIVDRGTQL